MYKRQTPSRQAGIAALFAILSAVLSYAPLATAGDAFIPERGVTSTVPPEKWQYGFLTGNGRIGTVVYGHPTNETVVFNHELLYLPTRRPKLPDMGRFIPEYRRIIKEKGHLAAHEFWSKEVRKQKGWSNYHSDPFHLACELRLEISAKGEPADYLQATDFQTGEVSARWSDDNGRYLRRMFVSRPDNVAVLSLTRPGGKPLKFTIHVTLVTHRLIDSKLNITNEWITYSNSYKESKGGYDNVIRVIARGGKAASDGKKIVVSDAKELLLLTKIERYTNREDGNVEDLKKAVTALSQDYDTLLKPHAAEHGEIFNRVTLDLGGDEDRALSAQELFSLAKESGYSKVPPALIEKLYDASRFYFICSAGETPPNLQGIWNGQFTAPWGGSYTLDTNVQLAMDSAMSGNMTEGMEGFFQTFESHLMDWRTNAKMLFGARGVLAPITSSPNTGLHLHLGPCSGPAWAWECWTAGAGWIASYFYDYYLFTGDREFLAKRAVPLMKEVALFYEDFLVETDENGYYIYRPSISPESGRLTISDNSTFDVSIAKELLTNLIKACKELGIEKENVGKWQAMLDKMPPYQVGPDGDLCEWADGTFRHLYNQRHHSPFYPVFRSFEFTPEKTPQMWKAAQKALEKKDSNWLRKRGATDWGGIPFGRAFHAQSAAYLGDGERVEVCLNHMTDRLYPSLFMKLQARGGGQVFNFDGLGAYPDIVNRSLAFSLDGTLDIFRSIPPSWTEGSISGILVRGQIQIDRLQWDLTKGVMQLEMTSRVKQEIALRLPKVKSIESIEVIDGDAKVKKSENSTAARMLILPADKRVVLTIKIKT